METLSRICINDKKNFYEIVVRTFIIYGQFSMYSCRSYMMVCRIVRMDKIFWMRV